MFYRKVVIKISRSVQENTCAMVSFLKMSQAGDLQFYFKKALVQAFLCEFCVTFNDTFKEQLWWLLLRKYSLLAF